ncbi:MAG: hypothetical protein K6T86_02310 [Pirellulales bacterium]|nr:hypothetical protein [Pirellulales bacterium]
MRPFEQFEDRTLLAAGDVAVFINLFTDNGGVPGSPITNDTVLVGQTFFVEVTFQDTRPEVQGELRGIVSFAINVGWHAASLEEVDDPFDPTDLNSPLLPVEFDLFRQGTLDNPAGEIIGLGGGGLFLSGGQPTNGLGVGTPARFSLMKFQAEAPSGGPQPFTIVFNEDLGGALADGVSLTTADITIQPKSIRVREAAGILVTPTSGLVTTEAGGQATFTVVLTSEPTADVTIDVASGNPAEGTVSTSTLVFTSANWNVPQTVTVTGVDDFVDDGDQAYFVLLGPVTSDDPLYAAIDPDDVALTNLDDDTAGILVTPTSGLVTTEAGGQATFTVVLTSEPTADVTIDVASGNPAEGTVSTSTLVFTSANWNVPQTVTVTGVDDFVDDGDQAYFIVLGPVTSDDPLYAGIDPDDVAVTNLDDDTAGILVTPTSGLITTEAGGTATFTVVLTSEPLADVTIDVASSNPAEGTVSTSTLVFTSANWNVPQTVTVTGVDDSVNDGDVDYTIVLLPAVSGDPLYAGLDPDDVSVTNLDDDASEITVTDNSGAANDQSIQFTTNLSAYRAGRADSPLVRPNYPDNRHFFTVTNTGLLSVTLFEIVINAPDVSVNVVLTSDPGDDIVLGPGASQTFVLTYAPTLPSLLNPTRQNFDLANGVVLLNDSANLPQLSIRLRGQSTYNSDITYDGRVNLAELGVLNANFGRKAGDANWDPTADINGDGRVNLGDLGMYNAEFGRGVGSSQSSGSGGGSGGAGGASGGSSGSAGSAAAASSGSAGGSGSGGERSSSGGSAVAVSAGGGGSSVGSSDQRAAGSQAAGGRMAGSSAQAARDLVLALDPLTPQALSLESVVFELAAEQARAKKKGPARGGGWLAGPVAVE